MDLYEELLGLIDALTEAKLNYALCGGIAVAFHGYPRFTRDIDLLIRPEDLDRVLGVVQARNFLFVAGRLPLWVRGSYQGEIYRISKVEGQDLLTLDLVIVNPVLQDVWEGREAFEWRGRQVQVVSSGGLLKMKRLAGRDQDLLDLKRLGLMNDEKRENS